MILCAGEALAGKEVMITSAGDGLFGTLEMPAGSEFCPVALIIAGSGPTDRDGNNPIAGSNNGLKMLAEGLAEQGVASLRFDKRGVGQSGKAGAKEEDLRFDTYVDDAVDWCAQLRENSRFSHLLIVGHSEGALIATIAGRKARANGVVSIAGTADAAYLLILDQLKPKLPDALYRQSEAIVARLQRGERAEPVPPELHVLFRPSVQPYLISWFKYDPVVELRKLGVPVLIVHGTTDIQVPTDSAHRLSMANAKAEKAIIEGMNHILKIVPDDVQQQIKSYGDPTLPVAPELIRRIAVFAHELTKSRHAL